jgi:CRISPR/Cas system-associated endonuclease Cas1
VQDLADSWQQQHITFLKDSERMLREAHENAAMAAEAAAARLTWEAAGHLKHQELQSLRQQRELQEQVRNKAAHHRP